MALAAPSMKAALEAWGSTSNLFHQGFAREADDPDVIAATLSKPGVIFMRPVGSSGPFRNMPICRQICRMAGRKGRKERHRARPGKKPPAKTDDKAACGCAGFCQGAQAAGGRAPETRNRPGPGTRAPAAIARAQSAMDEAERDHDERAGAIEAELAAVEKRSRAEEARWEQLKGKLESALRRARQD